MEMKEKQNVESKKKSVEVTNKQTGSNNTMVRLELRRLINNNKIVEETFKMFTICFSRFFLFLLPFYMFQASNKRTVFGVDCRESEDVVEMMILLCKQYQQEQDVK